MSTDKPWLKNYDPGVPHTIQIPEITCHRLLEDRTQQMPEGVACTIFGMPTTYGQLNSRANQFAHALLEYGIKKGDRVALVMGNSPSFISCQYGILKSGATVTTVNPLYTGRELTHILADSGARLAVVLSLFASNVAAIKEQTSLEKLIVVTIPGFEVPLPPNITLLDEFMANQPTVNPDLVIDPMDPALLLYTGGTTGRSKGAILHHRSQVYSSLMMTNLDPTLTAQKDSFVLVNPLFHIMGNAIMTFCLHAGMPIHLVPQYDPGLVLQTIHQARPTWFPGVATMFIGMMNHPDVKKYDLTSIKYCVAGAAPFPLESMKRFENITGCRVAEVYGLTESGAAIMFNPFVTPRKPGSAGLPTANMEAKIVDVESGTKEMAQGQEGEIIIKGPPIMMAYHNMPEETASVLRDGWLYTGDIGRMDEDGFFWIVDRKKDMVLASGFNVYPCEVDEVLYQHPKIAMACAVGIPDAYRGETLKAFCVLKSGETCTPDEVISFCREKLTAYKVPKLIEFRESLPTSIIGKVLRKVLREEEAQKNTPS